MGFGRKWLDEILQNEELSPKEKAQRIMDEHISVTNGLKDERDGFRVEAEKVPDLQKQLDDIANAEDFKTKYEQEHQAFEDFRKKTENDANEAKIRAAYRSLLSGEGISEKRLDSILRVTDLSKLKLDGDRLADENKLRESINAEWGDFKTTVTEKGAEVEKPLKQDNNAFDSMSLAQKMQYANQNPSDPAVVAWLTK